jgi:serine/threonine protein kinase
VKYGKWETIKELGRGGQGTAYLAVNTERVDTTTLLDDLRKAVNALGAIRTPEQSRQDALLLLRLIEAYLRRESDEFAGVLKVLHEPARLDPKALARLDREVEVLGRVNHPHLITVLDASVGDGWFVTRYYRDGTLTANVRRFSGDPLAALHAFRALVEGVAELHRHGAVHRDIKPENIFLSPHFRFGK